VKGPDENKKSTNINACSPIELSDLNFPKEKKDDSVG